MQNPRKSSIDLRGEKHAKGRRGSRIENAGPPAHRQSGQGASRAPSPPIAASSQFKFVIPKPSAIVLDLMGVLVCRSFMSSSKEFRDFFQHNVLEYLQENWKQKQLKIMINFFRCSQANVPDEYKLADREEPREEQIKQAKRHVIWKLRNDPTNSALSLFMLGITEWGYKIKALSTPIYDEVPAVLRHWKETAKIPVYVGVGSADFLMMVLTNTATGNILPFFHGHMNIMDFDGKSANKDFKKLALILHLKPEKILYLTRFRQDCRRATESGLQSLIVLRPDFDTTGMVGQLKLKRGTATTMEAQKNKPLPDEPASPPGKSPLTDVKNPEMRKHIDDNIASLSLIDDHEDSEHASAQSSQIAEPDLTRYNVILSLAEIAFK